MYQMNKKQAKESVLIFIALLLLVITTVVLTEANEKYGESQMTEVQSETID